MARWTLVFVLCSATAASVSAQHPSECIDTLSDAEVEAQNRWLDNRFQAGKTRARLWWYGQMVLWGAIAAYQTVLAVTADDVPSRFPAVTGTVGAWLSFLQVTLIPQEAAFAPQRFRRHPAATPEDRREKLRYGLRLLERAAGRQTLGRGFMANVTPLLWTSFWTPYFSVRFKDPPQVLQLALGGILLSEFRIWTLPQQARWDWDVIRQMACGAGMANDLYVAPEANSQSEARPASSTGEGAPADQVVPSTEPPADASPAPPAPEGPVVRSTGTGLRVTW